MRLVYVSLAVVAGILLVDLRDLHSVPLWGGLVIFTVLMSLLNRHNRPFIGLNILTVALALGGLRAALYPQTSDLARWNDSGGVTLVGPVVSPPDVTDTRTLLQVSAERVIAAQGEFLTSGTALVQAPRWLDVAYGDRVTATGRLVTPGVFDTFSYADYLARRGVFSVLEDANVTVTTADSGTSITARLYHLREGVQQAINRALPEPGAGLLVGILTGDERGISPALEQDFQVVGASHIIAISGFNMVVIAGVTMAVMRGIFGPRRRWTATIAGLGVIALYTLFTGAMPPVTRAALMTGVYFIGQTLRRRTFVPASLAAATLILIVLNPTVIYDVGFQLSLVAVLGLAYLTPPLARGLDALLVRFRLGSLSRALQEPIVLTLAAQIAVLPLTLLYFGRLTPYTLLVNALIVPVQAYLLIFGGLAVLTVWWPVVSAFFFGLASVLLAWSIAIVRGFADLPGADAALFVHPRWIALFYLIGLGWLMIDSTRPRWWRRLIAGVRRRFVLSVTALCAVLVLVLVVAGLGGRPAGRLDVWFLDVGHSNGVLIRTPSGATILVDGGRYPSRLLTALGDRLPLMTRSLSAVILTQPDANEIGAVEPVLARYDTPLVFTNGQPNQSAFYADLLAAAPAGALHTLRAGHTLTLADGVVLEVLHPPTAPELADRLDDGSLVVRVRYGDVSFLLTGDLSPAGQAALMTNGMWPTATVLQVPRQGGRDALDRAFLAAVQPSLVVLQVEANHRFDPATETLDQLAGWPLLRTDEAGTIHLWTDGTRLWTAAETR
jgi:competence protein ComEC